MGKLKPFVIVLSRNYSTRLGVIRSIGAAGYPVELIASVKKKGSSVIASSSKYVRKTTEVLAANIQKDSGEELIKAIMKYVGRKERKKILFPTDDFTTSVLDAHRDLLKAHFMLPHIVDQKYGSITEFMKKTVQSELAREVGLYTPHEWVISLRSEICIPRDMVYPCFVKPLQSVSGYKTEMRNCVDEKELKKHLFGMKDAYADRDILVQEYLHIDKEYDLSGVCLDQQIIAPLAIEKTGIAQYERGVARSGKVISAEILSGTKEKIESLLKKFHYVGMFDMDLNLCGGKVYFGEITFYPASGFEGFKPEEWDLKLGEWIKLPTGGGDRLNSDDCSIIISNSGYNNKETKALVKLAESKGYEVRTLKAAMLVNKNQRIKLIVKAKKY